MIKIDMEMPESCDECPLRIDYENICAKTKKYIALYWYNRHPDCQLIEVKE